MAQGKCKGRNQSKKTNGIELLWIGLPYFLVQGTTTSSLISKSNKIKLKYLSPKVHHHTVRAYHLNKKAFKNKWIGGVWVIRRIGSNEEHPNSIHQYREIFRMYECPRRRLTSRLLWTIFLRQMTPERIIFSGSLLMSRPSRPKNRNNMWYPQISLIRINRTRSHLWFEAMNLAQSYHMRPMMAQASNPTPDLTLLHTMHR